MVRGYLGEVQGKDVAPEGRTMKIYVDFDDVLTETAQELAALLWTTHRKRVDFEAIADFNLQISFGLDADEYRRFMEQAHAPDILARLRPVPDACGVLRRWLDDGLRPVVVTGRPASSHADSRRWLDDHGLTDMPLIHVNKYQRNIGHSPQGIPVYTFPELQAMNFAYAVDDAPPALDLLVASNVCPVVIFDRPWNRGYIPANGGGASWRRATHWAELDRVIRSVI